MAPWCSLAQLEKLACRLERSARDLLWQISAIAGAHEAPRREAMRWLFAVLEVDHAVIDLRSKSNVSAASRARTTRYVFTHSRSTASRLESLLSFAT
jgi:hypothetical protein